MLFDIQYYTTYLHKNQEGFLKSHGYFCYKNIEICLLQNKREYDIIYLALNSAHMVGIVQLVRMPDCGSGGRGFESHYPPQKKHRFLSMLFLFTFPQVQYCFVLRNSCAGIGELILFRFMSIAKFSFFVRE